MQIISSKNNQIIKDAASLQEKKYRDQLGLYILEGPNIVKEAMDMGGRPRFIFIKAGADSEVLELANLAEENASAVYELSGDAFSKICLQDNPQGIVAVVKKRVYSEDEFFERVRDGNILVLDRIQDPGNMGTLIRSAEALGFKGVIFLKGCTDPYQPKVVRAAAGSILRMPMLFVSNPAQCLGLLKGHEKEVYAAAMKAEYNCTRTDLRRNAALVIGNEGNGVCEEFLQDAKTLAIPMAGATESLNAAIAGSILMYESFRQTIA